MKLKIYADKNHNKILQTAWDTLSEPLVKKARFSLYRLLYILTNPSPYKKFTLIKEKYIPQTGILCLLCKVYRLHSTALRDTGYGLHVRCYRLQTTKDLATSFPISSCGSSTVIT